MGILFIGVSIGLFFGVFLGVLANVIYRKLRILNRLPVFKWHRHTGQLILAWEKLKGRNPVIKLGNERAMPLLEAGLRFTYKDKPAYIIDTQTGEPFKIHTPEMEYPWPNAHHRLKAHMSIREERAANASNPDATNWAKYGAIAGAVSVFLVFITLIVLWQSVRRFA